MTVINSRLINLYYKILNSNKIPKIIKSLKIFYIIKIHPEYIEEKKYSFKEIFKKTLNRFFYVLRNALDKIIYKEQNKLSKCKILVLSHLLNKKQLKSPKDFYFGNFKQVLKRKKISYQFILINHTKTSSSKLNKINNNNNKKWIIENILNLRLEIYLIFIQFKYLFWIIKNKRIFDPKISLKDIIISLFHNETKFALRCNLMIRKYLQIVKPKYLISTFEGFPWERQIFKTTKEFDKKIKIIGYQQVFLNENYKSIFYRLSKDFDPDVIWTLDNFSKKLFLNSDLKYKEIKVVGNLKSKKKVKINKNFKKNKNNILVIPEGIESECIKLFSYTLSLAIKYKKLNFCWRVHPVIKIENIFKKMKINKHQLPFNISISKEKNLEKDFCKCKFVVYRGSSTAIDALNFGLVPIYFKIQNEPNIDILRSYKKKLNYVKNTKDFYHIIKSLNNVKISHKKKFREDANIIRFKELTNF